ncbi:hypothetical protein NDU88_000967 [Pleurodeles waltl]|uniref:Uncharacterized protein n=1 Tax=Pleurodeles waltl TaxID=8319 RepID=A0AAV7THD8_PLEWA|nr:hypothetical protein NDU88_000967 [Pleurodeles waltl]
MRPPIRPKAQSQVLLCADFTYTRFFFLAHSPRLPIGRRHRCPASCSALIGPQHVRQHPACIRSGNVCCVFRGEEERKRKYVTGEGKRVERVEDRERAIRRHGVVSEITKRPAVLHAHSALVGYPEDGSRQQGKPVLAEIKSRRVCLCWAAVAAC